MKDMTYEEALAELQSILRAMQEEQISIDELAGQSRRATELIRFCREKLRGVESEIEGLSSGFEAD